MYFKAIIIILITVNSNRDNYEIKEGLNKMHFLSTAVQSFCVVGLGSGGS